MTAFAKSLMLCAAQVALVASLGGKLLLDRATLPRVWARAAAFDPDLAIRGRYVSLRVFLEPRAFTSDPVYAPAALSVKNGKLIASPADGSNVHVNVPDRSLGAPVAFFIPDGAPDPSHRAPGEELWVEVTVPKNGPPRPIRLGVKKAGVLSPLD